MFRDQDKSGINNSLPCRVCIPAKNSSSTLAIFILVFLIYEFTVHYLSYSITLLYY